MSFVAAKPAAVWLMIEQPSLVTLCKGVRYAVGLMLQNSSQCFHLVEEDEEARIRIAGRVGERLALATLSDAERLGAETLARELVSDAIERVRRALAEAVKEAKFLPRDIALRIAHDTETVASPFLEATDVFTQSDWLQLILTISRGARVAVARRRTLSEGIALALAEVRDTIVAETLIDNPAAPLTPPVCHRLIESTADSPWVLDKLAERGDLHPEIVVKLCEQVSAAARMKLARAYELADLTTPVVAGAEADAVLNLIRETAEDRVLTLVEQLKSQGKLTTLLLLTTLRDGLLPFFSTGLSILAGQRMSQTQSVVLHGGAGPMIRLLSQAGIPSNLHDDFWETLLDARSRFIDRAS